MSEQLLVAWFLVRFRLHCRAPSHIMVTCEDKCHISECPPLSALSVEHESYGMEYSSHQLESAVTDVFSPSFLYIPSLLAGRVV